MGTTTPYHHGSLRRALHDAALRLIAEHGADAFTLKQAAAEAGVSVAAPYRHYGGKADLLGALAAEGFTLLADRLRAAAAAEDPAQALLDAGLAYLAFADEHRAHFEVMFHNRGREPRAEGAVALDVLGGVIARLEAAGRLAVPPPAALRAAWASVHGLAVLRHGGMRTVVDDDPRSLRDEVLAPLLSGGLLR
ncbi:TetR/AcrR family transcriptional regulator [Glycomyces tenuis]|uniref:TetR/AcrR family transcriptional regulator n=1 Tax=Glycomyces tenuis TaxID=58116 RepID=UPI00054F2DFA|nr:TetR/AcrR family transcriptional regulator [Glycomyces tenuis]